MAVLTCHLCERSAKNQPIFDDGKTFCCHGCRDLWLLLGEENLADLKRQPRIDWSTVGSPAGVPPSERAITGEVRTANFHVSGLWCPSCSVLVEHVVNRLPGVAKSEVRFTAESLQVQYNPRVTTSTEICDAVHRLGYNIQANSPNPAFHHTETGLMRRFVVSAALSVILMMISVPVWSGYLQQFPEGLNLLLSATLWGLTTPIVFWSAWPFIRGAWTSICHRVATMDLLITIASFAAYAYSVVMALQRGAYLYFDTCGFLITFLLLGRLLETGTRERALAATRHLSGLVVREATVLCEGKEACVPVEQLRPGDLVIVRPGGRVPVDGVVEEGTSDIDESFLTGESMYSEKHPGNPVYAGSTSYSGRVLIKTTREPSATILAQTLDLVREAQARGHAFSRVTDRVLRIFTPAVLVIAVATFCFWEWVVPVGIPDAALRAIATLVIACPCALSVAAPVASQCAVQALAQFGVLLRSDEAIERCAQIDTVVFDKTGTLTEGLVQLTDFHPNDPKLLQWAASLESASEHPLGRAVVSAARSRGLPTLAVSGFAATPGEGVTGTVDDHRLSIVRYTPGSLPTQLELAAQNLGAKGQSLSVLWVDGQPKAVLAFADAVRADARDAVRGLQSAGVAVHMATGDRAGAASQIASHAGIETWRCGLTPMEKSEYIQDLQSKGKKVAYVGDGVNDAAALIQSDVGIAMGSGTDVAVQAGHFVLMQSQLTTIPIVLDVCRRAENIIRQNLAWAILYNFVAVSAAIAGWAGPAVAAAAMMLSSLFVLGNALRLLGQRPITYSRTFGMVIGMAVLLVVLVRLEV